MKSSYTPPDDIQALLDRVLDVDAGSGGLTRVETSQLEEWMQRREARLYYVSLMMQESMMHSLLAESPILQNPFNRRKNAGSVKSGRFIKVAAISLMLILFFFAGRSSFDPMGSKGVDQSKTIQAVFENPHASVTGMIGVRWSSGAESRMNNPQALQPEQRLIFDSGLIELVYQSGVRVTLEGPADYTITGAENGRLEYGKLVTFVPKGREGFAIHYPHGQVVDLGTEFAMDLTRDGKLKLGVFDGEVELHLPNESPHPLLRDQALVHDRSASSALRSVPFERERFVRNLPSRDFAWTVQSEIPREIRLDVTHLIWRPSQYHAIFKWIDGMDAIEIRNVELRRDDQTVAIAPGMGVSGFRHLTRDNRFVLDLEPCDFRHGACWTVHATVAPHKRYGSLTGNQAPVISQGILQFEEGLVSHALASDFIGRWAYHHAGARYVREFHPDGTISLSKNGVLLKSAFDGCIWSIEDGILRATQPLGLPDELHVLRDSNTLIFLNQPYHNASREALEHR